MRWWDSLDTGKFSDYKYIKIVFKPSISVPTEKSIILDATEFALADIYVFGGKLSSSTSSTYARLCYWLSDTSIQFGAAYPIGSTTSSNTYVIPLYIKGMK